MNVSQARDFRNSRIGGECPRDKVDLFRLAPPTSALRARKYSNLPQRIILAPVQTPVLALVLTLRAAASRQGDLQRMLTFKRLYPILQDEARRWLEGKKKTAHPKIADRVASERIGQSYDSDHRRIMMRLASDERKMRQGIYAIVLSEQEYPFGVHIHACKSLRCSPEFSQFRDSFLERIEASIDTLGGNCDPSFTADQVNELARKVHISGNLSSKKRSPTLGLLNDVPGK